MFHGVQLEPDRVEPVNPQHHVDLACTILESMVLDVGTGCMILAMMAARANDCHVYAAEIMRSYLTEEIADPPQYVARNQSTSARSNSVLCHQLCCQFMVFQFGCEPAHILASLPDDHIRNIICDGAPMQITTHGFVALLDGGRDTELHHQFALIERPAAFHALALSQQCACLKPGNTTGGEGGIAQHMLIERCGLGRNASSTDRDAGEHQPAVLGLFLNTITIV